jgi:hypothetical protein
LRCHDDVALCDGCIGWLGDQRSQRRSNRLARAVPILATANVGRAVEHYAALGSRPTYGRAVATGAPPATA